MVISVFAGGILGFLSGLGIGGGSLLLLWLTLVQGMDPQAAREINLLFFLPSALICSFFRWRQGSVDIPKLLPAILTGCIAAFFFSRVGNSVDTSLLKKIFGILLILTGLREIFYRQKAIGEGQ